GFQRSEFLLEHGAIDMIVARSDLPQTIALLIANLQKKDLPKTEAKAAS
ncbi:MAG TPA: acetyl-CoA carboxylase carboxyl transferase subunit beta, partial [Chromatiales bacterium]|nr:acetyl-CoA carboxylase carboxyl transferase subunit beta [Chromatiales bacterium]